VKKIILVSFLSLVSLLFVPLIANASLDTNLYYGLQKNSDVKQLQEFLIDKGFLTGDTTGNFFSLTLKAVKAYQKSIKVSQSGYVGTLTRTAINNELAANLSASNQEATNETGATPPTLTPPATTNDVVATLQAQIALLLQQVQAMQAQQATSQQIAQNAQQIVQNTQQIVQNTTPVVSPVDIYPPKVKLPNFGTVSGTIYISRGMDVAQDYGIMPIGNPREGKLGEAAPLDKVELYIDGNLAPVDYNPYVWMRTASDPGKFELKTGLLSNGKHTLTFKAYDAAGNIGEDSEEIEVNN